MNKFITLSVFVLAAVLAVSATGAMAAPPTKTAPVALILVLPQGDTTALATASFLKSESAKFPNLPVVIESAKDNSTIPAADLPVAMLQIPQLPLVTSPFFTTVMKVGEPGFWDVTFVAKNIQIKTAAQADEFLAARAAVGSAEVNTLNQLSASRAKISDALKPVDQIAEELNRSADAVMSALQKRMDTTTDPAENKALAAELTRLDAVFVAAFNDLHAQDAAAVADLVGPDGVLRDHLISEISMDNGIPAKSYGPSTIAPVTAQTRIWTSPY